PWRRTRIRYRARPGHHILHQAAGSAITGPPATGLEVTGERRGVLPVVVPAVAIGDRRRRQFLGRRVLQAADVHAHHLAYLGAVADSERPYTTNAAKVMLVLHRIEQILGELGLPGQQPEGGRLHHGSPEAVSTANRTVTAVSRAG